MTLLNMWDVYRSKMFYKRQPWAYLRYTDGDNVKYIRLGSVDTEDRIYSPHDD